VEDGEVYSQPWQKRIPAVLFTGHTTQPRMKVSKLRFRAVTLPDLKRRATTLN
jgi:hypothetical protein